jgi:hypothetical protein
MEKWISVVALFVFLVVFFGALFALPVWLLWNWLGPVVFGLREITFLQAWGLNVLCGFLFKSTSVSSD